MPCRIKNCGQHPLRLDLRGGRILSLRPGEMSPPLADEALATNPYLPRWLRDGSARRVEVADEELASHVRITRALAAAGLSRDQALADLERVAGVGPSLAMRLLDRGVATSAQLAAFKPSVLAEHPGIGKAKARKILASARRLNKNP